MYGVGAAHAPRGARLDRQTDRLDLLLPSFYVVSERAGPEIHNLEKHKQYDL